MTDFSPFRRPGSPRSRYLEIWSDEGVFLIGSTFYMESHGGRGRDSRSFYKGINTIYNSVALLTPPKCLISYISLCELSFNI